MKKIQKISLTIFALFLSGAGCIKNNTYITIVEGVVINTGSGQGIDSVLVTLQDGVSGTADRISLETNTSSGLESQVYTDSTGAFRVDLQVSIVHGSMCARMDTDSTLATVIM